MSERIENKEKIPFSVIDVEVSKQISGTEKEKWIVHFTNKLMGEYVAFVNIVVLVSKNEMKLRMIPNLAI